MGIEAFQLPSALPLICSTAICRYVYLLDEHGRMRWRGSGHGRPEEVAAMLASLDKLITPESSRS